jgi:hypothetical protein
MIAQSVAEILADYVKLSVEGIDRLYLNVYVCGSRPNWELWDSSATIVVSRCHRGR